MRLNFARQNLCLLYRFTVALHCQLEKKAEKVSGLSDLKRFNTVGSKTFSAARFKSF